MGSTTASETIGAKEIAQELLHCLSLSVLNLLLPLVTCMLGLSPFGRAFETLDGLGLAEFAVCHGTPHRLQRVALSLVNVSIAETGARQGVELRGHFHQPLQHRMRVDLDCARLSLMSQHVWSLRQHSEAGLHVCLREDAGQDSHPPLPQFGNGLPDRPEIQAAVLQQRDHRALVGAWIRLWLPVVRIV